MESKRFDAQGMALHLVEWTDSFGCSTNWTELSDIHPEPMICKSVGWLAYDGEDCVVVVPHISTGTDQGCGDMTIPRSAIVRVTKLEEGRAPL